MAQHKSARRDLQEQLDSQSRRVIQLRNPNQGITNDNESVQQDLINIDTENLQIGSERMKLTYAMLIIATSLTISSIINVVIMRQVTEVDVVEIGKIIERIMEMIRNLLDYDASK